MAKTKHRIRRETRSFSLANPSPDLYALFGVVPTSSGVAVTAESALRVPAVSCAIRAIAETIATLPVHVYERQRDGSKQRAVDHPAYGLLHDDANDWTSAYDLKLAVTIDALTSDRGGFAWVNRIDGRPREILRLDPTKVTVTFGPGDEPVYTLQDTNDRRTLDRADVIHIRPLGHLGRSPLTLAREAIGIAIAQAQHAGRLFGTGGRPSGILKLPTKLSPEAVRRIAASWSEAHAGGNSGKTAVLEEGADFSPITFNAVDMQHIELARFMIDEIARAFRVPPHMLMELGRATWSNAEEMGQQFLTYSLLPWIEAWQGAFRRALFTREERATYAAEFLVDDLLRADIGVRAEAYSKLIASRVINPNEARAMENRAPYAGGDEFINPNTTSGAQPLTAEEDA